MLRSLATKAAQTALVLLIVSMASFVFLKLAPGDPVSVMLGSDYSKDAYDKLYRDLGLDQPVARQYVDWVVRFVQGDWGTSYISSQNIFRMALLEALPVTLTLAALSLLIALAVGIPAGMAAALKRGSWVDVLATSLAIGGNAFPSFYLGIVLIWVFGVGLGWFPTLGFVAPWRDFWSGLWHLALPAITLGAWYVGLIATTTRSSLLDVLGQP